MLWVNLHGGFVALVVSLLIIALGSAVEALLVISRGFQAGMASRNAVLTYGRILSCFFRHKSLWIRGAPSPDPVILSADWIKDLVEEFQSPRFQAKGMLYFEVLLIVGILVAARLAVRREIASALLVLAWAHASLISVRHIPVFAIVCLPARGTRVDSSPGSLDRIRNMDISRKSISVAWGPTMLPGWLV